VFIQAAVGTQALFTLRTKNRIQQFPAALPTVIKVLHNISCSARGLVAGLDDDVVKRGAEAEATELPDNASAAPDSLGDGIASTSSFTAVYSPPHSGFPSAMLLRKRKKPARKSAVCESFFLHQFLKLLFSGNFWKCFCK
jgi:hypothetical protein